MSRGADLVVSAVIVRLHRYRIRYMIRRPGPNGSQLMDLFQDRAVQCVARCSAEAIRRYVPADALAPQCVREG